jgi:hypothetical protein
MVQNASICLSGVFAWWAAIKGPGANQLYCRFRRLLLDTWMCSCTRMHGPPRAFTQAEKEVTSCQKGTCCLVSDCISSLPLLLENCTPTENNIASFHPNQDTFRLETDISKTRVPKLDMLHFTLEQQTCKAFPANFQVCIRLMRQTWARRLSIDFS